MRITVYDDADAGSQRAMVGWFNEARAEHFEPDPLQRHSVGESSAETQGAQSLYRTSLGRWVLRQDQANASVYRFLSPAAAHSWLTRHGLPDVAARFFTPRAARTRPRKAGRPEVGGPVAVRLGVELLTEVDNYAGARHVSRADAIRDLIKAALTETESPTAMSGPGS